MSTVKPLPHIEIGYQVGHLAVEFPTADRHSSYTVWHCKCDCGGEILLDTRYLQRGTVTDCGCMAKGRPGQRDLTGQKFGRLVCIEPTTGRSKEGSVLWRCRCDCGSGCFADGKHLLSGYKKSCGCLSHPPLKEYSGTRFGRLTVIEYAGKRDGMHRWKCRCDCGRETIVGQTLLQSGKTRSCGCFQAEMVLENLKFCEGTFVTILEATKRRRISSNRSGFTGVYQSKRSGKWISGRGTSSTPSSNTLRKSLSITPCL